MPGWLTSPTGRSRCQALFEPASDADNGTYPLPVDDDDLVAVSLTRAQWSVVQEALDECYYVVEHSPAGGLRKATKERYAARRDWLLATLPRLDVAIYQQAGVGPIFGEYE